MKTAIQIAGISLLLFAGTGFAHHDHETAENTTARSVVENFLKASGSPFREGLPDAEMQEAIRPYLSKAFFDSLAKTKLREEECVEVVARIDADINARKAPGDMDSSTKPPLIESTLLTSGNEAPHKYRIIRASAQDASASIVTIEYTYVDENSQDAYVWRNDAILVLEEGEWKIDDFLSIPRDEDAVRKRFSVRDELNDFPSCEHYFEEYEKDHTYRH